MANSLEVNADGLRVAAASSDSMSATLTRPATNGTANTGRLSSLGIAAVDSANTSVRGRQSSRISGQAGDLCTGADRYDDTDGGSAENITVTV
jgi:hypothetical protein